MFLFRRFFWLVVGFALGVTASWTLTRRLRRFAARYAPPDVVDRWGGNVRAAVKEGRVAMRSRESELKSGWAAKTGQ